MLTVVVAVVALFVCMCALTSIHFVAQCAFCVCVCVCDGDGGGGDDGDSASHVMFHR